MSRPTDPLPRPRKRWPYVLLLLLLESGADALSWQVAADAGCLQHSAELAELHWMLGRIPIDAVSHGRAKCRD